MTKTVQCVCGEVVRIAPAAKEAPEGTASPETPVVCPVCGRAVATDEFPPPVLGDDASIYSFAPPPVPPAAPPQPSADAAAPTVARQATEDADGVPLFLRLLLDPTTIRRLLMVGGGVSVLGLIAWLVSLGVFDDPRVLAVALATGNLALLASGWGVSLRTNFKLAGQALTFLGCVLAPLNLWFYDSQNLLTTDGRLWVGGSFVVCCTLRRSASCGTRCTCTR